MNDRVEMARLLYQQGKVWLCPCNREGRINPRRSRAVKIAFRQRHREGKPAEGTLTAINPTRQEVVLSIDEQWQTPDGDTFQLRHPLRVPGGTTQSGPCRGTAKRFIDYRGPVEGDGGPEPEWQDREAWEYWLEEPIAVSSSLQVPWEHTDQEQWSLQPLEVYVTCQDGSEPGWDGYQAENIEPASWELGENEEIGGIVATTGERSGYVAHWAKYQPAFRTTSPITLTLATRTLQIPWPGLPRETVERW